MYENKSLQLAFLISMLLHFAAFISAPYTRIFPGKEPSNPIKVAYFKAEEQPKKIISQKGQEPQKTPIISPESLPKVAKEDIVSELLSGRAKKEELIIETIKSGSGASVDAKGGKKFETVINEEKDNTKKSTYIGYYRSVREKIRYYADGNYIKEHSATEGEVFISFVVASNGELLHIMVIDNRSVNSSLLRNIAINSVRDASPFPAFPQGLNQYQITFNVVISFELNK